MVILRVHLLRFHAYYALDTDFRTVFEIRMLNAHMESKAKAVKRTFTYFTAENVAVCKGWLATDRIN